MKLLARGDQLQRQFLKFTHDSPPLRYDERMKSKPNAEEQARFNGALRQVLSVSKEELQRREKQYQEERANKPKRGPKPKHS